LIFEASSVTAGSDTSGHNKMGARLEHIKFVSTYYIQLFKISVNCEFCGNCIQSQPAQTTPDSPTGVGGGVARG